MEVEFLDIDKRNAWGIVFQEIREESNNFSYVTKEAKKSENKNLNRYRDVNPFDHSRVRLQRGDKDYINASLVDVPSANRSYILTQGPLPVTTGHFWLMIWEQKSNAILMLNHIIEKNAVKCHQYWPVGVKNGGEDEMLLYDVGLKITFIDEKDESYYMIRKLCVTDLESQESRTVLHFHYTTWPDFGVPESPEAFLNFLFAVRKAGVLNSDVGPPVVHCSAGIGRSGTFCLADSCLVLIEKSNDPDSINIRQRLLEMRRYRMGLIQTPDQLRFSYLAIIEGAKKVLSCKMCNNVPFVSENSIKGDTCESNVPVTNNSEVHKDVEHVSPPPPLPPRCTHDSEKHFSKLSTISNNEYAECNGKLEITEEFVAEIQKHDDTKFREVKRTYVNSNSLDANFNKEVGPCTSFALNQNVDNSEEQSLLQSTSSNSVSQSESLAELRKRARKEREEKTAAMIQNIKKKQKESEHWAKRRLKRKRRKIF